MIIVFGSNGRLGKEIVAELKRLEVPYIAATRQSVNVTSFDFLRAYINGVKPTAVINCTAFSGIERCHQDPAQAFLINSAVPSMLSQLSSEVGAFFLHFSTDYVFEGIASRDPHKVDDACSPLTTYGTSKLAGEYAVRTMQGNGAIIRLSSLYSDDREGAMSVLKQFNFDEIDTTTPILVFRQYCAPSPAWWIAKHVVAGLVHGLKTGDLSKRAQVFHLTPADAVWKEDFARHALRIFRNPKTMPVIKSGKLDLPRPVFSLLDSASFWDWFAAPAPSGMADTLRRRSEVLTLLEESHQRWSNPAA